ncbi:MAG: nucleotidyl transferase AbiEii/AbiGii toxin family protein [Candidatus Parvarchaeota archaeon]
MEPIGNLISGERLKLASMQDYVVDLIYSKVESIALLYGETAVWRCYGGMRFSEDIDIYLNGESVENFLLILPRYGMRLLWRDPEFPMNFRIAKGDVSILIEAREGTGENTIREYYRVDGSSLTINVLTPTELFVRKIQADLGRRFVRDIYDLFVLTKFLDKKDYIIRSSLSRLLDNTPPPLDEKILRSLIYAGNANVTYSEILNYLRM